jgi:hypothetical protein
MTRLLLIPLLALVTLIEPVIPAPKKPATMALVSIRVRADTVTVTHRIRLGVSDGKGAIDSVLVTETGGTFGSQAQAFPGRDTTFVTFSWIGTAGQTLSGQVCAKTKRRGVSSSATCKPWSKVIPDIAPPPPIIDTTLRVFGLMVRPRLDSLALGATGPCQCVFFRFTDGAIAEAAKDRAQCDAIYMVQTEPPRRARVSPGQQAVADTARITWSTAAAPPGTTMLSCGSSNAAQVVVGQ